jgi:hypothetical protein
MTSLIWQTAPAKSSAGGGAEASVQALDALWKEFAFHGVRLLNRSRWGIE